MKTMLLPDATILSRPAMRRTRVNGVGQSTGGGFWSWLGDTVSPVIQSTAPGAINQALGIESQQVTTPQGTTTVVTTGTPSAAKSNDTWKWVGVIGLSGLLVFMVRRRRRGR